MIDKPQIYRYQSPVGAIIMSSNGKAITGLWFEGQKYSAGIDSENIETKDLPVFRQAADWLNAYFSGKDPKIKLSVYIDATPFRQSVLNIVRTIPYGETRTYGDIANQLAQQQAQKVVSPRAVANAVAHNPILLIIPCHRVIGANGRLTGYVAGLEKKAWLLNLESERRLTTHVCI